MNVLVTGGAGFIGSHLVERLVHDKHNVIVIDNLLRGNKIPIHVQELITFIEGDVRDLSVVMNAMEDVDVVYHFAAVLGVDVVADFPVETMDVEVIGTRNIIEAMHKHGVKQLFYASTSGIYSHSAIVKTALSEEVLVDPRTSYAMAKRYNEIYLASHFEEKGVNTILITEPFVLTTSNFLFTPFTARVNGNNGKSSLLELTRYCSVYTPFTVSLAIGFPIPAFTGRAALRIFVICS